MSEPATQLRMMRCEPYRVNMLESACASRWRVANGKSDGDRRVSQSKCAGCPVGEANVSAGAHKQKTLFVLPSSVASAGAVEGARRMEGSSRACNRCMKLYVAFGRERLCPGCKATARTPSGIIVPTVRVQTEDVARAPLAPITPTAVPVATEPTPVAGELSWSRCGCCGEDLLRPAGTEPLCSDCTRNNGAVREIEQLRQPAESAPAEDDTTTESEEEAMPTKRDCATCGKAFTPSGPRSKYCSDACKKGRAAGQAQPAKAKRAARPRMPETGGDELGADLLDLLRKHGISSAAVAVASDEDGHTIEVADDLPIVLRVRNVSQLRLEQLD